MCLHLQEFQFFCQLLLEFVCHPYTENGQLKRSLRNADNLIGWFCLINFLCFSCNFERCIIQLSCYISSRQLLRFYFRFRMMIVVSDALFLLIVIQLKEMGGSSRPTESLKTNEQPTERKKGLTDWMNIIKPGNEEKDHWVMLALFFWVE